MLRQAFPPPAVSWPGPHAQWPDARARLLQAAATSTNVLPPPQGGQLGAVGFQQHPGATTEVDLDAVAAQAAPQEELGPAIAALAPWMSSAASAII